MRRGEKELLELMELALYKMNLSENVKKGWPGLNDIRSVLIYLKKEVEELEESIYRNVIACNDAHEQVAFPNPKGRREIELELADVTAFCAIILSSIKDRAE